MKKKVSAHIRGVLGKEDVPITKPKDLSHGHFCTPVAFQLAKELRQNPHQIARDLSEKLLHQELFEAVEPLKGYVNFKLSDAFLDDFATTMLGDGDNFGADLEPKTKILLEYVSANPTGPLHIGHARGAVFGDALARIGRHLGYRIDTEYYVNDAGNQIQLLGTSLFLRGKQQILGETVEFPDECYQGDYIGDLAEVAADHFGKEIFASEERLEELALWAKDQMLELIKSILKNANIEFDSYVSEKALYGRWEETRVLLEKNNALRTDEEGKIWLKSSEYGDGKDRVVVRENGIPTYLAGDIIYHNDKFNRPYDRYINIWGADHHGYIPRVKAAVAFLGHDKEKLEVQLAQMVALLKGGQPYKMSKRSGNFVLMSDVMDEVGADALRFIFLTKKADTHLEFDLDVLQRQDSSNPVYYVNYAHARINQVFGKAEKTVDDVMEVKLEGLSDEGKKLLFSAMLLPEVLEDAFDNRNPQVVTEYLYKLASQFHKFYTENRVVGSDDEAKLLKLFAVVGLSIRVGMGLLGITAKERM